ncbi:non-specific serine/threonine protein kinase [Ranunculus cassubicifolius]
MCSDVSTHGDVYSFGVLLLELFTGRRPTDGIFVDGLDLYRFATVALPTRIMEIVDPVLLPQEEEEENCIQDGEERSNQVQVCVASIVRIGVTCSAESPRERMNMEEVVKELNSIRNVFLANHVVQENLQ